MDYIMLSTYNILIAQKIVVQILLFTEIKKKYLLNG